MAFRIDDMRAVLDFLLLDGFDPATGELALRVALAQTEPEDPRFLRLRLKLGHPGDPLQPLKRELATHLRLPLPAPWERGLRLVIHAIEEDMARPGGGAGSIHDWVKTQIMHPSDDRRSTLGHPMAEQARILFGWAERLESNGEPARAAELLERMLLLSPGNPHALRRLSALLRDLHLVEESLGVTEQWMGAEPEEAEAPIRHAEALLYLERPRDALRVLRALLQNNPMHPMAHIGAAQAKSLLGGDPYPHLDAAFELDGGFTEAVLKATFDYRALSHSANEASYTLPELQALLGVTRAELRTFAEERLMPLAEDGSIHESDLSRWVGIQNRYNLLPYPLHWSAPTPRKLPDID